MEVSKHPSPWRGEQGLGHEADWWARLGKSQRKASETKARVDVSALQKQASWQAARRGSPGSHIQAKMLHPSDSSDCGHPNVRSSASSFEMPFFLKKGQKGTPRRLTCPALPQHPPRNPSYLKFPSPRKRWVVYKRVLTAMFFIEALPPWLK